MQNPSRQLNRDAPSWLSRIAPPEAGSDLVWQVGYVLQGRVGNWFLVTHHKKVGVENLQCDQTYLDGMHHTDSALYSYAKLSCNPQKISKPIAMPIHA